MFWSKDGNHWVINGRKAFITGASGLLGAHFARVLAQAGAKVVAGARRKERIEALAQELNGIMAWIEQLAEVDTDGAEPLTSVVAAGLPMREDVVTMGGDPARVTSNAPKSVNNFFVVPKVVE